MIGRDVFKAPGVEQTASAEMASALERWTALYSGRASWLKKDEVLSLGIPAAVASEIARIATIEMRVELGEGARAAFLADALEPVLGGIRSAVEFGCALGGLALKPYFNGRGLAVDVVLADSFAPLAFDASGRVTEAAFKDRRKVGDFWLTRVEHHRLDKAGVTIRNRAFRSSVKELLGGEVGLDCVEDWAELEPEALLSGASEPLFGYFKYPGANYIDPGSPLGLSCFARAEGLIEQADKLYSNLTWEFESGRRAIYADVSAFEKDKTTGGACLPDKRLYRTLQAAGNVGENELFKDWSPAFREASILSGLDAILKKIEFACGLAYGTISDPNEIARTATEITITKQRTFATVVDAQRAVRVMLEGLLGAMDYWATVYKMAPAGTYEAAFTFDDSVIIDRDLQFQQDMRLVAAGLMSRAEFRMRNFGESAELAREKIAEAAAEAGADVYGAGFAGA